MIQTVSKDVMYRCPVQGNILVQSYLQYARMCEVFRGIVSEDTVLKENWNQVDKATIGYGVGNVKFWNGDLEEAKQVWEWTAREGFEMAWGYHGARLALVRLQNS